MNLIDRDKLLSFLILLPIGLLMVNIRDYFYLLVSIPKGISGGLNLFLTVLIWLVMINIQPFQEGKLRTGLGYVFVISIGVALLKWVNIETFNSISPLMSSIKTDDFFTGGNVKILTASIMVIPGLILGSLYGGIVYFLRDSPTTKYLLNDFKITNGFSLKNKKNTNDKIDDKPDIELCSDRDTGDTIFIRFFDAFRHLLVLGPTGCGKTSLILIKIAWQIIKNPHVSLLALDPKGDFAHYVSALCKIIKRPCLLLDPIFKDCPYINPLVGDESDVIESMVTTFEMLGGKNTGYFKNMDERLLRNTLRMLKRLYNDDTTFIMVNDVFNNIDGFGMKCIAELANQTGDPDFERQNNETVSYFRDNYYNPTTRFFQDTSDIRNNVANLIDNKYLRKILNPPQGKGSDVDFDVFLKDGGIIAISLAQGPLRSMARYFGLFVQLSFQASVFRRPLPEKNRRMCVEIIDEMQVVANEQLADMFQQARSLRCMVIPATQSLEQVILKLGDKGKAFLAALKTNCQNRILFAGLPPEDAEMFSKWSGTKTRDKVTQTVSKSKFSLIHGFKQMKAPTEAKSVVEEEKPRLSVDEIIYMDAKEVVYFISENMRILRPSIGNVDFIDIETHEKVGQIIEDKFKLCEDKKYTKTVLEIFEPETDNEIETEKESEINIILPKNEDNNLKIVSSNTDQPEHKEIAAANELEDIIIVMDEEETAEPENDNREQQLEIPTEGSVLDNPIETIIITEDSLKVTKNIQIDTPSTSYALDKIEPVEEEYDPLLS